MTWGSLCITLSTVTRDPGPGMHLAVVNFQGGLDYSRRLNRLHIRTVIDHATVAVPAQNIQSGWTSSLVYSPNASLGLPLPLACLVAPANPSRLRFRATSIVSLETSGSWKIKSNSGDSTLGTPGRVLVNDISNKLVSHERVEKPSERKRTRLGASLRAGRLIPCPSCAFSREAQRARRATNQCRARSFGWPRRARLARF